MDTKSLTRRQKRQIALYLHFRNRPMSVNALFWFNRGIYAITLTAGVASAAAAYWLHDSWLLTVVVVAYGAMLLRDVGYYWRSKSVWPVLQDVLAWDKLQQLNAGSGIVA